MPQAAPEPSQVELHGAYQEYRGAMAAWRAAEQAGRSPATEATTDRLLKSRVALYRALVTSGWVAPAGVVEQLERDAALLEAPEDFDSLLTS